MPWAGNVNTMKGDETIETGYGFENIGELIARKNVSTMQLVANLETSDGWLLPINILPDTGSVGFLSLSFVLLCLRILTITV